MPDLLPPLTRAPVVHHWNLELNPFALAEI